MAPDGPPREESFGLIASCAYREYFPSGAALIAYKLGLTNFGPFHAPLKLGKISDCFSLIRLDHCTSITVNQIQASFGAHSESDHLEIVTTEGQILELKAYQVFLFTRDLRETLTIRFKPSVVGTPTTLIGTFTPLNERILVDISDLNPSELDRDDHQFPPANLRTLLRTVASNSWQSPTPQHLTLQLTHKQISALGFANASHFFAMVQDRLSIDGVIGCDFSLYVADSPIEPATLQFRVGSNWVTNARRACQWLRQNSEAFGFDGSMVEDYISHDRLSDWIGKP